MTGTSAIASKTLWLNLISFILVVLALPEFISVISPSVIPWIALITAILNAILRIFFVQQPITRFLP